MQPFDGFFSLPSKADCIFIRLNGVVIEVVRQEYLPLFRAVHEKPGAGFPLCKGHRIVPPSPTIIPPSMIIKSPIVALPMSKLLKSRLVRLMQSPNMPFRSCLLYYWYQSRSNPGSSNAIQKTPHVHLSFLSHRT